MFESGRDALPIYKARIRDENPERVSKRGKGEDDYTDKILSNHGKIISIGFLGITGSNSAVAAEKYDKRAVLKSFKSFSKIIKAAEDGDVDLGVLPIENSLEGRVKEVNDLIINNDISIIAEINLPISYSLLAHHETDKEEIRRILSHPQALGQCREYIEEMDLIQEPYHNTAGAAKKIAEEGDISAAAIAREECADIYGLKRVEDNIQDEKNNITRFIVVAREGRSKGDKTSVVFSVDHKPGALHNVLKIFAELEINLTRIESIPNRSEPWRYYFHLDFLGGTEDEKVKEGLQRLKKKVSFYKHLGCYYEDRYRSD